MTDMITLKHGRLHLPDRVVEDGSITISDGKITAIGSSSEVSPQNRSRVVDLDGALVCPGFIDIHCNGGGGALFMDATTEAIHAIARAHAATGTTGLLATTVAWEEAIHLRAVREAARFVAQDTGGARVLGVHMEGPFLNPKKAGAHDPSCLRAASIPQFDKYLDAANGTLKMLTLAPEVDGAMELIRYARNRGVCVSAGHTIASYEATMEAIAAGVSVGAHLFNAVPGITAREPGPVTAMLLHDGVAVELITDGVHVHPALLSLTLKLKGTGRILLVTDASPPSGTSQTEWTMKGTTIAVRGYTNYLPDGTIAGSALTMGAGVRLFREMTGLDLAEIVPMSSTNQARLLGIDGHTGSLTLGKDADIVILSNDDKLDCLGTIVRGTVVSDRGVFSGLSSSTR